MKSTIQKNNNEKNIINHFVTAQSRHLNFDRPRELAYTVYESNQVTELVDVKAELHGVTKLLSDFKKGDKKDKPAMYREIIDEIRKHR